MALTCRHDTTRRRPFAPKSEISTFMPGFNLTSQTRKGIVLAAASALTLAMPATAWAATIDPATGQCVTNSGTGTQAAFVTGSAQPGVFQPCDPTGPTQGGQVLTTTTQAPTGVQAAVTSTTAPGNVQAQTTNAAPVSSATANPSSTPAAILAQANAASSNGLAFTGSDIATATGIGAALVALGGAVLISRRRTAAHKA